MARTRKTIRLEEGPETPGAGGRGGSDIQGIESQSKMKKRCKEEKEKEMASGGHGCQICEGELEGKAGQEKLDSYPLG